MRTRLINRRKYNSLYKDLMESISKNIKRAINEAGNGYDMNTVGKNVSITLDSTSSKSLRSYLNLIGKFPMLSLEEELELARKYQEEGDENALNKLINCNLRFVVAVAKKYKNSDLPLEDLIDEGNLGLIEAAKKYTPDLNNKLVSYAIWYIRRNIISALDNGKNIQLPYNITSLMRKIKVFQNKFEQEEMRKPTIDEIADEFNEDRDTVIQALKTMSHGTSIDEPSLFDDDESGTVGDTMSSNTFKSPAADVEYDSNTAHVKRLITNILKQSDPKNGDRNAEICLDYYGFNGDNITINDLTDKFGLTSTMILKIVRDSQNVLKKSPKFNELREYLS